MDILAKVNLTKENRRFERLNGNFTSEVETPYLTKRDVICKNISEGGAYLEITFNKFDSPDVAIAYFRNIKSIFLRINLNNEHINTSGVVKWSREISSSTIPTTHQYGIGVEFLEIPTEHRIKIRNTLIGVRGLKTLVPPLPRFPLLINGKEVDTGNYEYQPYVEKLLIEPNYTFFALKNIKQDKLVDNYEEYIYAKYCIGNDKVFQEAITSAYEASLTYRNFDVDLRTKIIIDIHNKLLEFKNEYINLLVTEGHPKRLAEWEWGGMFKGTSPETVHFYRMNLETFLGYDKNEKICLLRKPDGVVCLLTPKNAPSSISVIGVFALMAGNTLIVKPPLSIPVSTIYFWKDIVYKSAVENGAPPGVINIIIGNSQKILQNWLNSPFVNDIIYIGNSKKGLEIGKQIYLSGKKPILELSGNDKMIIWKDAPIDSASDALKECFYGSSQICMVPKIAFIHEEIFDDFMDVFIEKVKGIKPGLPSDPNVILSPVGKINDFYHSLNDAIQKGGKLICGGIRLNCQGIEDNKGIFIQPTVVVFEDNNISHDIFCLTEENFFPLLPVIKVSGKTDKDIFEKIIKFTESDGFGLRISIWTQSENYIDKFVSNVIPGGIIRINSSHIGFSLYLSNNGGTGKTSGPFGEMSYIWQKTTHLQGVSITSL